MNIVLIMAKEGSIGLPGKNTWKVKGKSLLEWTIEDARNSKLVDRVFVSTNGETVARNARVTGAEVILREHELAKNEKFLDAVDHAVKEIKKNHSDLELIAIPQTVVPFRAPDIFDRCFKFLKDNPVYDSAVTVRKIGFIPEAIMKIDKEGHVSPYFGGTQDKVSPSRQDSAGYEIDHTVECFRYRSWLNRKEGMKPWDYMGRKIKAIEQNHHNHNCFVDVHTPDDIKWLEFLVEHLGFKGMRSIEGKK